MTTILRSKSSFCMGLKVKRCHLKTNYVSCKPHGNHEENTYRRYTVENEKGIKACLYKKKKQWSTKDHKRKRKTQKLHDRQKRTNDDTKSFPPGNYFKCKCLNSSIKTLEWLNRLKKNKIQLYAITKDSL